MKSKLWEKLIKRQAVEYVTTYDVNRLKKLDVGREFTYSSKLYKTLSDGASKTLKKYL
ncbi:MAG: hypothetical protein KME33_00605 [Aetokthonos hydrillicola CCALA 1050]|jgi:hypothetical protein|nr:hypothetical protein [Aetokthonos hydrillicola CCALA 1050]